MKTNEPVDYLVRNWNPLLTFTCSLKQIKAWFLRYGKSGFYNGRLWTMKQERLCPGLYHVKFVEAAV